MSKQTKTADASNEMEARRTRMHLELAIEDGAAEIENAIDTLERTIRELKRYLQDYRDDEIDIKGKRARIEWTINYLASNVLGNCRLDLMAKTAAQIATFDRA